MDKHLQDKPVLSLECLGCSRCLCTRAMAAYLLADTEAKMYSSDLPELEAVEAVDEITANGKCHCLIQDLACKNCGGVVGYRVVQPCSECVSQSNNGHFWIFFTAAVSSSPRNGTDSGPLLWQHLRSAADELSYRQLDDVTDEDVVEELCLR